MSNPYYNPSGNPSTGSAGLSATMRAEFTAIQTGFALLPVFSGGNAGQVVAINSTGTAWGPVSYLTFDSSGNATVTPGNLTVANGNLAVSLGTAAIHGLLTATGGLTTVTGNIAITGAGAFSGPGTGLTGTAAAFNIGGNAATATSATSATNATNATNAVVTSSSANAAYPIVFSPALGGNEGLLGNASLSYNPSTGALTNTGTLTNTGGAWTPRSAVTAVASTTINCALSNYFYVSMGTSITTLTISNPGNGQSINIRFKQGSSGGPYTVAWPAAFRWNGGVAPVLSTPANAEDFLAAQYDATDATWVASLMKGVQ